MWQEAVVADYVTRFPSHPFQLITHYHPIIRYYTAKTASPNKPQISQIKFY
jgi:hypothetical protein